MNPKLQLGATDHIEVNGKEDHVHPLGEYPPSRLVKLPKGSSSRLLRSERLPKVITAS